VVTVNSHQPYLHLLAGLDHRFTVVDRGLPGCGCRWDEQVRPLPDGFRTASLPDATRRAGRRPFDVGLAHNMTDLLALRRLCRNPVLIIHTTLTGRAIYERSTVSPRRYRSLVEQVLAKTGTRVVFVSLLKMRTWDGLPGEVIRFAVPESEYHGYSGRRESILRVSNLQDRREVLLHHSLQQEALRGLPTTLLGHNPGLPGARAAGSWQELKGAYRDYRCFLVTNDQELEDGYNLSLLEAMTTGMPIVTTPHPSSPVRHGVEGLVGETAAELRGHCRRLLADRELAVRLGRAARATALERFPYVDFLARWQRKLDQVTAGDRSETLAAVSGGGVAFIRLDAAGAPAGVGARLAPPRPSLTGRESR